MKKIIILFILIAALGAFFAFGLGEYFSLEALKQNRSALLNFTADNFFIAVLGFIFIYILQTAFSLPGGAVLTMAGGFLFGSLWGTLFVNIGATAGATIAFLAARYVLRDWVENKFGNRIKPVQDGIQNDAFNYLLTLRLIPAFPFFLVNLVSGLTRMPLRIYILATAIGILPGSFVFAYAGRKLGSINSPSEILSPQVIFAFVLLAILAATPIVYKKIRARNS